MCIEGAYPTLEEATRLGVTERDRRALGLYGLESKHCPACHQLVVLVRKGDRLTFEAHNTRRNGACEMSQKDC